MRKSSLHLAIGHYVIGYKDGVNTVLARTVNGLRKVAPNLRITVFGKASPDIETFLPWKQGELEYIDIPELDIRYSTPVFEGKSINDLEAHDYIWLGTNIARKLLQQLQDADVIMMENLALGINPAVTYAFYLMANRCYDDYPGRKFLLRIHDFAQQRPDFFRNIKKFQRDHATHVPNWHELVYPGIPNVDYIVVNSSDKFRLLEHGIEESRVHYVPNFVTESLLERDEKSKALKKIIRKQENISADTGIILYPVRCIWRKNVEEAIFITQLLNRISRMPLYKNLAPLKPRYHLLVSLPPGSPADKRYAEVIQRYIKKYRWPVTIGLDNLVALRREHNQDGSIARYNITDLFQTSNVVITTSYLEGFGMVFIEPWLADKHVIGRNLPLVSIDFCHAGVQLGHLYNVLLIDGQDYRDIGVNLSLEEGLEQRLNEILRLEDDKYVDKIVAHNASSIWGSLRLFETRSQKNIIQRNKRIILKMYSQKRTCRLIHQLIRQKVNRQA